MMKRRLSRTPIVISLLVLLLACPLSAWAGEVAGKVINLSGALFAERDGGTLTSLQQGDEVRSGDRLITKERSYARIRFLDDSMIILRPNSQLEVKEFVFRPEEAQKDSAIFNMVKGGLRAFTGQIGDRGDKKVYRMGSPGGTIGIRGTIYTVRVCRNDCEDLKNGVYFTVIQGAIDVTNAAGSIVINAGEMGYSADDQTQPVLLKTTPLMYRAIGNHDYPDMEKYLQQPDTIQGNCEVR